MTSTSVADIVHIQLLAVTKCVTDSSLYVGKCAANSLSFIAACGDVIKGMKLLLAMLSKDIPEFFPVVVKDVVARSNEVKEMSCIYLVQCVDHVCVGSRLPIRYADCMVLSSYLFS